MLLHMQMDVVSIQQKLLLAQPALVVHFVDDLVPGVPMHVPVLLDIDAVDIPCVLSHDV